MQPKTLCEKLGVGPQLQPDQMQVLADQGYKSVINCRPDGEQPGQPTSAELEAAAKAAGLGYAYVPTVPGKLGEEQVKGFDKAMADLPQPIFSFCKTGMRASSLWALCRGPELGADEVVEKAAEAGYDIAALKPRID